MEAEMKVINDIDSPQLKLLFENLKCLMTPDEESRIKNSFFDILLPDILELDRKRTENKIRETRNIEGMKENLWKIREQIVSDGELFVCCFWLDLQNKNFPKKIFLQFVQAEILLLIFQARKK